MLRIKTVALRGYTLPRDLCLTRRGFCLSLLILGCCNRKLCFVQVFVVVNNFVVKEVTCRVKVDNSVRLLDIFVINCEIKFNYLFHCFIIFYIIIVESYNCHISFHPKGSQFYSSIASYVVLSAI